MPILEDVKAYMQRATGLRRPGKKEAPRVRENLIPLGSRMTVSSPIIPAGPSSSIGMPSISATVTIRRP
jgi:hypothetical protein